MKNISIVKWSEQKTQVTEIYENYIIVEEVMVQTLENINFIFGEIFDFDVHNYEIKNISNITSNIGN